MTEETDVKPYVLPELLSCLSGERVRDASQWVQQRRGELIRLFEEQMYGKAPARPPVKARVLCDESAMAGAARRKIVELTLSAGTDPLIARVMMILPPGEGPHPAFADLNFRGNHGVTHDPGVPVSGGWTNTPPERTGEAGRGFDAACYPPEEIVARGYALVTCCYGDFEPDTPDGWRKGIRGRMNPAGDFAPGDWGAISTWAWGLSCIMDYLETDELIDASRVAVVGHSRLGKTALWAGAQDQRFAMVISNESGQGGAALSKRRFGETVAAINRQFPHWFCGNHKQYNDREDLLPIDQHMLLALTAPRPLYIASAAEDLWADPKGEFLSAMHAGEVYRLLGKQGLGVTAPPPLDRSVGDVVGYHNRTGPHDLTTYDWRQFLNFADRHFR